MIKPGRRNSGCLGRKANVKCAVSKYLEGSKMKADIGVIGLAVKSGFEYERQGF